MEILQILSTAVVVGFINGSLPGPISTAMFTQILRHNLRTSLKIALWAGFLVGIIATAVLLTFHIFQPSPSLLNLISLIGGLFLLYLAWKVSRIHEIKTHKEEVFTFGNICAITFLNSSLWLSWLTVFLPEAFKLKEYVFAGEFLFLFAYEISWLAGLFLMAFIFSRFRSFLTKPKNFPYVFKFFALLLIFFAIQMMYSALKFLF